MSWLKRTTLEKELLETKEQLAAELADMQRLHELSTRLSPESDFQSLVQEILQASVSLLGSTMGCVQLVDTNNEFLEMHAHMGYKPSYVEFFKRIRSGQAASGTVWSTRDRVCVDDVLTHPVYRDQRLLNLAQDAGFRAVCSTPLLTRTGEFLGTLTINFTRPHQPSARQLRLLDLYARQAAEVIELARRRTEREAAQEALRKSEAATAERLRELESVYAYAPIGLCVIDKECRWVRINNELAELNGFPAAAHIGKRIRDLLPDVAPGTEALILRIFETGEPVFDFEYSGETAALPGVRRTWRSHFLPLRESSGAVTAVNVVVQEVTEQLKAEAALRESEARLSLAQRAGRVGVFDWNLLNNRVFWTAELEEIYGLVPGTFEGDIEGWRKRVHPEDLKRLEPMFLEWQQEHKEHAEFEYRFFLPHGELRWISARIFFAFDDNGRAVRMLGTMLDITERKAAEDALRQADRRKDQFLAMLGHELRNPLAAITSALKLLTMLKPEDAERNIWAKGALERQVKQLRRLVDDLLDVSRISRGKIQLRLAEVDLRASVSAAVEAAETLFEEKKHAISVIQPETPVMVRGDSERLQQIVVNLLSNAAKYTDDAGEIEVRVSSNGAQASVAVKDNGIGIPAELQGNIFEMFGQTESAKARSRGGLGIGLYLVKFLIELHGGKIELASEGQGKGSTFTASLPLLLSQKSSSPAENKSTPAAGSGITILLFEDNSDVRQMIRLVLEQHGHKVWTAASGAEALLMCNHTAPDLVILDIGLPDMSGVEVARQIRTDLGKTNTVIVAASGFGQKADREEARAAGVNHYFIKPLDYEKLAPILASLEQRAAKPQESGASTTGTRSAKRILVIEDSRPLALLTKKLLEQQGHDVKVAHDGESGIDIAKDFQPEVVFCDISLPGVDGFQVAKELRGFPPLRTARLIALTGKDEKEVGEESQKAGFEDCLLKPVSLENLESVLSKS